MDFSSCIKTGIISSLESLKNISEISKNPYSSFFQILQDKQDKKNSSMYPVLAEINSYAQMGEYDDIEDNIKRKRKLTFNNELMQPFDLNGNLFFDEKNLKSDQKDIYSGFNYNNQDNNDQYELDQQMNNSDQIHSNEQQKSEWGNEYDEDDQEYEDECIGTPGFTSQHPSPVSKRMTSEYQIKSKSCAKQNQTQNDFYTRSQMIFEGSPIQSTASISPQNLIQYYKYPQMMNKKFRLEDDIEEEGEDIECSIDLKNFDKNINYDDNEFNVSAPILTKQFMSTQFNLNLPAFGQSSPVKKCEQVMNSYNNKNQNVLNNQNLQAKQPFKIFDTLVSNPKVSKQKGNNLKVSNSKGFFKKNSNEQIKDNRKGMQQPLKKETIKLFNIKDEESEQQIKANQFISFVGNKHETLMSKKIEFNIPFEQNVEYQNEQQEQNKSKQRNKLLRKGSFCCVDNEDEADIEEETNSMINSCYQLIDSPFSRCYHEIKPSYSNLDSHPQQAHQAGYYKSIGMHLERLQKLVDKIKLTQNPHKYIFNSQHTILSKDKDKQMQFAFRSQKSYQRAFIKLDTNFKLTMDFIISHNTPIDSIKQSMVSLYDDSKFMALPQSYDQLIQFIKNLNNLINHFYVMITSQVGFSSTRENLSKLKLQKHVSTPSSITTKSLSLFSNTHSYKQIKKSNSIAQLNQLVNSSHIFGCTSTAAESEFKQDQSTRNLNSLSNLGQQDQIDSEPSKNNCKENLFHFVNSFNKDYANSKNYDAQAKDCTAFNNDCAITNKDYQTNHAQFNENNQIEQEQNNLNPFNLFNIKITEPQTHQYDNNIFFQSNANQNTNPFFGFNTQEQSSRGSSIRSSHFNQDIDIQNSFISTPNNVQICSLPNDKLSKENSSDDKQSQVRVFEVLSNKGNIKQRNEETFNQLNENTLSEKQESQIKDMELFNFQTLIQNEMSNQNNKISQNQQFQFINSNNIQNPLQYSSPPMFKSQQQQNHPMFGFNHTHTHVAQFGNSEQ